MVVQPSYLYKHNMLMIMVVKHKEEFMQYTQEKTPHVVTANI